MKDIPHLIKSKLLGIVKYIPISVFKCEKLCILESMKYGKHKPYIAIHFCLFDTWHHIIQIILYLPSFLILSGVSTLDNNSILVDSSFLFFIALNPL